MNSAKTSLFTAIHMNRFGFMTCPGTLEERSTKNQIYTDTVQEEEPSKRPNLRKVQVTKMRALYMLASCAPLESKMNNRLCLTICNL